MTAEGEASSFSASAARYEIGRELVGRRQGLVDISGGPLRSEARDDGETVFVGIRDIADRKVTELAQHEQNGGVLDLLDTLPDTVRHHGQFSSTAAERGRGRMPSCDPPDNTCEASGTVGPLPR